MTPGCIHVQVSVVCAMGCRSANFAIAPGAPKATIAFVLRRIGWSTGPAGWLCPAHNDASRQHDLRALAEYVLRNLTVAIAPADTYVKGELSAEEVLSAVLGRVLPAGQDDWAEDDLEYARELLRDLGAFLKTCQIAL